MSLIKEEFEPDVKLLEGQLRHWFGIDQLRPVQGIAMLIGLIPDDKVVAAISDWGNNKSRDDEILDYNIKLLNGDEINSWPKSDHPGDDRIEAASRFSNLVEQHSQIKHYWLSGDHPAHPPLSYFIEWARSKGIKPDWVPIAVELGLIPGVTSVNDDMHTESQVRGTYSTKWLGIQLAAIGEFFNPRRNPDAKKDEVVDWINDQAVNAGLTASNNIAETIFTIIKPENHDPKKKRGEPRRTS